jgi:hypothetical protein
MSLKWHGQPLHGDGRELKPQLLDFSELRNVSSPWLAANAFHLPFLPGAFDFMACSSVLHHSSDSEVVKLIVELRQCAAPRTDSTGFGAPFDSTAAAVEFA